MGKKSNSVGERGRWTSKRKSEAVQRLLRGEDLDTLSRELRVTAATLSEWREAFLAGAEANLKSREPTPQDDENLRLRAMVGDLMMRNELLRERIRRSEEGLPLLPGRSKR